MLKDHIAACQSNGENPELTPFWRFTTGFMREVERTVGILGKARLY
jgi:hypothetical protein